MPLLKKSATGNAAISTTVTPSGNFALESMTLHLSAAGGAANLTLTLDAADGAAYDTVIYTQDMTLVTDLYWKPDTPMEFEYGSQIVAAWVNGAGRTYGLTIRWIGR